MKFKIKELAKIKEADIEIKDLTILVGKNSTNKSYSAHIVYMLNKVLSKFIDSKYGRSQYTRTLFSKFLNESKNQIVINDLKKLPVSISEKEQEIQLDVNDFDIEYYREVTFDFKNFGIEKLVKTIYDFIVSNILSELNLSFNVNQTILGDIIFLDYVFNIETLFKNNKITIINEEEDVDHLIVLQTIFRKIALEFSKQKACNEEFYFPASRTGFVLAFDEIVSGVLRDRFGGQPTATKLTEPTIDFISGFSDIKSGKFGDELLNINLFTFKESNNSSKEKMKKLFEFIENRIVKGKIIEENKGQNYTQFYLQPPKSEKLELHLTSSATVELLPLVIFLKHFSKIEDRLLVIEEPEAHLHPKAQIEMARLIVMLVNAGAKVLITTHSDYILSELSNCIKLSTVDDKSKKEYLDSYQLTEDTTISKERVSAYLFKDTDGSTEVIDLTIDEYGISNDNFDDILDELLDRTEKINEIIG